MEPTSTSDMGDSSDAVQQLRKRIAISGSLSIFKIPRAKSAAQKHPKQGTARVGGDARECRKPTKCHRECQQEEATVRQGRECHGAYKRECKMDVSHEGAARPTDKGWFRELADIGVKTPTTTRSLLVGPSTSYLLTSRTGGNTQLHRNMIHGVPILSRVLGSQQSPYSIPSCGLSEGGGSDKGHYFALYQNCQHKLAQGANNSFQQPGGVPFLVDEETQGQSQRGSQGWEQPGQPSPSSELGSSKQTKIVIIFPVMPDKDENQLITIFSKISRLHGCEFSMDKKECTLRKVTTNPPPVRHPSATPQQATPAESIAKRKPPVRHPSATSQQATPAKSVGKRKPQDTAGRRQRPAPSHQWAFLQNLQAQLQAVGTQLEAVEMPCESLGESSDSDDSLPLFPEVVMGTPPTPT